MRLINYYNPIKIVKNLSLFYKLRKELFDLIAKGNIYYQPEIIKEQAKLGSIKFTDAHILKCLLEYFKPKQILEVGSFLGFSTRWLLESSNSWNAHITSIDPNIRCLIFDNPRTYVEQFNSKYIPEYLDIKTAFFGSNELIQYYYDYEVFKPKKSKKFVDKLISNIKIINECWNRKFDFFFIDGAHNYKSVIGNFEVACELLTDNGCITFHDALSWKDVNRALIDIKGKYTNTLDITIIGSFERYLLKFINRANDGIGLIKLKHEKVTDFLI